MLSCSAVQEGKSKKKEQKICAEDIKNFKKNDLHYYSKPNKLTLIGMKTFKHVLQFQVPFFWFAQSMNYD